MPKIAFIFNPRAGKLLRNPGLAERTAAALRAYGPVTECPTTAPGAATQLAAEQAAAGAEWVAVLGGDGTLNEAANGLVGTQAALAPLPGGTANVFCVETQIGRDPMLAVARMGERRPVRIGVGRLWNETTSRYFLSMAGAGFDATVVTGVNKRVKDRWGKLAYWLSAFRIFGRPLVQFQSDVDGVIAQEGFVLACRVRNYGGDMEIARRVTLLDNCLEAVSFEGSNSLRYVPYLLGVAAGRADFFPGVKMRAAQRLVYTAAGGVPVPVQVDGELAGFLPVTIEMVPDALTVLLPETYLEKAERERWITSPTL